MAKGLPGDYLSRKEEIAQQGTTSIKHLEENIDVTSISLTKEEMNFPG